MGSDNRYGILLGMDHYGSLPALDSAGTDVKIMQDALLATGFKVDRTCVKKSSVDDLKDGTQALQAILDSISFLPAPENATLIIYYSGHGFNHRIFGYVFCCSDFPNPSNGRKKISQSGRFFTELELRSHIHYLGLPLRFVIVVVDACNRELTEAAVEFSGPSHGRTDEYLKHPPADFCFVYAAQPGQTADAAPGGPSYFTDALASGIGGSGSPMTLDDALASARAILTSRERHKKHLVRGPDDKDLMKTPIFQVTTGLLKSEGAAVLKKPGNSARLTVSLPDGLRNLTPGEVHRITESIADQLDSFLEE
jgi:hypothetical protein